MDWKGLGLSGADIDRLLFHPTASASLDGFADQFYAQRVTVRCAGLRQPVDDLALVDAVRGTLGRVLMETASPPSLRGEPCAWRPACAFDVLFRERPAIAGAAEVKPYVFSAQPAGEGIDVALTLFGLATAWTPVVAEALVRAVRRGIFLRDGIRLPDEVTDVRTAEINTAGPSLRPSDVLLTFSSPLRLRRGAAAVLDGSAMLMSLANRICGVARWHAIEIEEDWVALRRDAVTTAFDMRGMRGVRRERRSGHQGREMPIDGYGGEMLIRNLSEQFGTLLSLGAVVHAGSSASLGLGRYAMAELPV